MPDATAHDKVLVTGGAGFIGSHLVDALVARGAAVRVVDNLSSGKLENLTSVMDRIEFVEADLTDADVAARACEDVEVVFHIAALGGVPASMERPLDYVRHNVMATANILVGAKDSAVRRIVFSSSSSVYGGEGPFPQRETAEPLPRDPYAASKLNCEIFLKTFATAFGTDCVSLRYFNVYGPRQSMEGHYAAVFPAFISRMLKGEAPVIYGDGLQTRAFIYVSDVVRANLLAMDREAPLAGEVMNVAGDGRVNVLDIVRSINTALGTDIAPTHTDSRPGDVRDSWADVARAKDLLGFSAEVSIDEGVGRTIEHFRSMAQAEPSA
jgi:UDP-glucose 4-epimerase